jgi:hypothetical protein
MNNGDLEKYLGKKYAQEISEQRSFGLLYEECTEALDSSLKVLEMYTKVRLAMQGQHRSALVGC